jgi:hypothetical protein
MGYPRNSGSTTIMDLDEEHITITSWTCWIEEYNPQFGTEINPEVLYVTDRGEVESFEDIADA